MVAISRMLSALCCVSNIIRVPIFVFVDVFVIVFVIVLQKYNLGAAVCRYPVRADDEFLVKMAECE